VLGESLVDALGLSVGVADSLSLSFEVGDSLGESENDARGRVDGSADDSGFVVAVVVVDGEGTSLGSTLADVDDDAA
jgi:hypothetical protein